MRLVDIDDAIEKAIESDKVVGSGIWETSEVVEHLEGLPTVDAVSVVRCKDCKFFHKVGNESTKGCAWGNCRKHIPCVYANDFCSYGERRDKDGV